MSVGRVGKSGKGALSQREGWEGGQLPAGVYFGGRRLSLTLHSPSTSDKPAEDANACTRRASGELSSLSGVASTVSCNEGAAFLPLPWPPAPLPAPLPSVPSRGRV